MKNTLPIKLYFLFAVVAITATSSFAKATGSDTVFLDRNNQKVSRDSALYYKFKVEKLASGLYLIKDYFVSNNQLASEQTYKDEQGDTGHGHYISYFENGKIECEGNEVNGEPDGRWNDYREDGSLMKFSYFKNGLHHGDAIRYYPNGKIKYTAKCKNNVCRHYKYYTETGEKSKPFEDNCCPEHPVGYYSFYEYIRKNYKDPKTDMKLPKGKMIVRCFFNKKGKVDYIEFKKRLHPGMDAIVEKLIYDMPVWGPASDDFGKPTEFSRTFEIRL